MSTSAWWRDAVIYQVYLRSFADGNGDGLGDVAGIAAKLPYLATLGVDAIWINPWYPSPQADAGYDVADYRDIEPVFGTLTEAEQLIAAAHRHGIKIILDIVPNHTSDRHRWFQEALPAGIDSAERNRYVFRAGRGENGELPPTNWESHFGGPAWTRLPDGQWYLHLFAPEQPDLNWDNPEVHAEFEDVLRFWFDRGVDGFRIDVAHGLVKNAAYPDVDVTSEAVIPPYHFGHPAMDQDGVHEIYRDWRRVADEYDPPRVFVGEAWVKPASRLAAYVRGDELHTTFNFEFLSAPWDAAAMRAIIDDTRVMLTEVGAPATWVLSNHDVVRHVSRYGRSAGHEYDPPGTSPVDVAKGRTRARAAALLTLALPGGAYIYQGEELGLPEVEDLPDDVLQDPKWERSGRTNRGRDGCRVPIPWSGAKPPFGFSSGLAAGDPWLPQPADWKPLSAAAQDGNPDSMLWLYRAALRIRRTEAALGDGDLRWLDLGAGVLAFTRDPDFICVVNLSADPVALPAHTEILLSSGPLADGILPADHAAWLRT